MGVEGLEMDQVAGLERRGVGVQCGGDGWVWKIMVHLFL